MAEPKKKSSKRRQGFRRQHHKIEASKPKKCLKCGAPILPHTVCKSCGTYNK